MLGTRRPATIFDTSRGRQREHVAVVATTLVFHLETQICELTKGSDLTALY